MISRKIQLIFACLVPVLILLGMCATPVYTLLKGEEIILQTMPVDPSDLFRGDYVALKYKAEEVPKRIVEKEVVDSLMDNRGNLEVYVLFDKKNGVHIPAKVTQRKPVKGISLKGTLHYIDKTSDGKETAFIEYNLDKYYLPDNKGTEWEKAAAKGQILAKIKVHNGYGVLTNIEMQ